MKPTIIPFYNEQLVGDKGLLLDRIARRLIHNQLKQLQHGELVVREGHDEYYFGKVSERIPFRIHIEIKHPGFWSDVAFGGTAGSGEAYIKGSWSCTDLVGLVRHEAGVRPTRDGVFSARTRHLDALQRSRAHISAGRIQLEKFNGPETLAEELRLAQKALGEITGEYLPDDLLGEIFSRFCIGK